VGIGRDGFYVAPTISAGHLADSGLLPAGRLPISLLMSMISHIGIPLFLFVSFNHQALLCCKGVHVSVQDNPGGSLKLFVDIALILHEISVMVHRLFLAKSITSS